MRSFLKVRPVPPVLPANRPSFTGVTARLTPLVSIALLALSALILGGCGGEDGGPATRTFHTTITAPGSTHVGNTVTIDGTGVNDLYGNFTARQTQQVALTPGTAVIQVTNGRFTHTFPDGSSFTGSYSGTATLVRAGSPENTISLQFTVDGGTGRFAGATGQGTSTGSTAADGSLTLQSTATVTLSRS